MDADTIADLKQLISTTIKHEVKTAVDAALDDSLTERVRTIIREEVRPIIREEVRPIIREEVRPIIREEIQHLEEGLSEVKQQVQDLTDFVTNAIDVSNEAVDEQLKDHESRITNLEHVSA